MGTEGAAHPRYGGMKKGEGSMNIELVEDRGADASPTVIKVIGAGGG